MSALTTASSMSRACSLSRSGCLDALPAFHAPPAAPRPSPSLQLRSSAASRRTRAVHVRAQQQQPKGGLDGLRVGVTKFMQRYDPVTTGIGSLLVAGYCMVAHEQSVGEALNIAACATVLGMVAQEVLFNEDEANNEA